MICPYCSKPAEYVDSDVIYGQSYGMIYLCRPCNAYVGVHEGTNRPLGTLADEKTRWWRKKAHRHFDHIWKGKSMNRKAAYSWLAEKLGINVNDCHIAMFDAVMCERVVGLSQEWFALKCKTKRRYS